MFDKYLIALFLFLNIPSYCLPMN